MSAGDTSSTREEARSFGEFIREHKRVFFVLLLLAAGTVFVLMVLPQIAGFGDTLKRLRYGNKWWLALAVVFEALSLAGYAALFRTVFSGEGVEIGWSVSYQITMAGTVATKIFAAAGAGGVALTVWALRAAGLSRRAVARRMASFEILLYAVFMAALVVFGLGLATGLFGHGAPRGVTLVPAIFAVAVVALALAFRFVPEDTERLLRRLAGGSRRGQRLLQRIAAIPNTIRDGMVTAIALVRRPRPGLLGAIVYWALDVGTLWAAFRAFGASPQIAIVVMGYFVGQLANTIPLPGGVGGVEGGMIGCFIAFNVEGSIAVLAVLTYRALSFWLPTLPGALAYFQLRRTIDRWRGPHVAEVDGGR